MRQIIVLNLDQSSPGKIGVRAVFWFPIAAGRQYPKPNFQSAFDSGLIAASGIVGVLPVQAAEQVALVDGSVLEEVQFIEYPSSYASATAKIKAALQQAYTDRAAAIAAQPSPLAFYGDSFDGTGWLA